METRTADRILERLEALDARLDRLERSIAPLVDALEQLPALAATATNVVDSAVARADAAGLEPNQRLQEAAALLERATTPEALRALGEVLETVQTAPALAATAADVLDGLMERLAARGIQLDERAQNALRALEHLTHPDMVEILEHALQSGSLRSLLVSTDVFAPPAVHVVGSAAQALIETQQAARREVGMFGLLSAMRKPEVRRAAGFAIDFAENFGRRVGDDAEALTQDVTQEVRHG